ncbi:MAG TPA: hypothetical protein VG942_11485, partial [Hyphomonadaceae bacterium]|nr:hypothetical protein [Hyphomonadaceae bacterium]
MKQITFTAIGFLGIAALSLAAWPQQPQNSSPPAERERSGETMQQNVRKWVLDILGKKDQKISTGSIGQREAIVGREDLAVSGTALPPCDVKPGDPMETIVRMAAKTRVVIINERHNSPLERDYVGQVLKALRPLGYSIYAAEAFNYADLNTDKVYGDVGWYTNDPVFARTMKLAHSLGYRMLAYEQN